MATGPIAPIFTPVIFASTNKVYGDLGDIPLELEGGAYRPRDAAVHRRGIDERRPLDFHTPYGCSKGAADQYVLGAGISLPRTPARPMLSQQPGGRLAKPS